MRILILLIAAAVFLRVYFLILEQNSLYYPSKDIVDTPVSIGIAYEEVNFKTRDGQLLHGWFIPAADSAVTILYCHGNAGNISHRLHKVKFFHELGMNFFIFDYRGYGKSTGSPSEQGLYKDARAAYDYLILRKDIDAKRVVAFGKSLGAAVAADLCLYRACKALVLEGAFLSVTARAQEMYPFLPMQLLVAQKYDTAHKFARIDIPVFIAHGRQDEVIGCGHSEALFGLARGPRELLLFEGGHNDDEFVTSPAYKDALAAFFKKFSI